MAKAVLALRDVSIGYDGDAVLQRLTFEVEEGEFLALLGPNGAGKSTLLRGILGLIPILSGRMECGVDRGDVATGIRAAARFARSDLPLTAAEVVLMGTVCTVGPVPSGSAGSSIASPRSPSSRSASPPSPKRRSGRCRAGRSSAC